MDKYITGCISVPTEIKPDVTAVLLDIAGGWRLKYTPCSAVRIHKIKCRYCCAVDLGEF